ncbi:RICIN domain-containing protein [Streptomyces triticisoli]|uniref:RICIN domain-containing protein n=1 Tax=Streptomyces triticisoli TaxID=2182797 RepID=UPI000DDB5E8A|nr:RICIN domain-containing protein [Streptomyces triticisoli]
MARADGTDKGVETGDADGGPHEGVSDMRLTGLLGADTPTVYPALRELRARHLPSVLAYARQCTTSESTARQIAAQAFTLAARETARGVDPGVPVRPHLLLLTTRLAAAWARDERSGGVDTGLLLVLNTAGPEGPVPPLLTAFQSLPTRTQGLLWYGAVEQEPEDRTATFLGVGRQDVAYGVPQALKAMAQASLRSRLAASDDPRCGDFRRLIEEAVRPDHPRPSSDLHTHMAHCGHCTAAFEEQSALRDHPRTALAEGLLPWGGTAYVTRRPAEPRPGPRARAAAWSPSRRYALASAALGVALAPLLLFLVTPGGDLQDQHAAGAAPAPAPPVEVTVTATVPVTPPPPSPSATSRPPSPKPTPSPSRTAPPKPDPTPTHTPTYPPGAAYAQVVNVATGRCLDVAGDFDNGTDVVTAPCGSAATQRWRVDSYRGVLQSAADPDFCLDSRGSVEKGVGIWTCSSVEGRNGRNLTFTVDPDGVIRPAVALATGLAPNADGDLSLTPLTGSTTQRWRAGDA